MRRSRPRLASNVLAMSCSKVEDRSAVRIFERGGAKEFAGSLSYWHLVGLREAEPFAFPKTLYERDNLNERQLEELDAWLQEGSSLLWPELEELRTKFSPVRGRELPNPFEEEAAENDNAADQARTPDSSATKHESGSPSVPAEEKPARGDDSPTGEEAASPPLDGREQGLDGSSPKPSDRSRQPEPDAQAAIVDAPLGTSLLVLAPPGTGKTHVLVERLVRIVSSGAVSKPSEEILLLSFTRAAVAVMKDRILARIDEGAEDDLRYCSIRTFDSFATLGLMEDHDLESFSGLDYDRRIDRFNALLRGKESSFENAIKRLCRIRFLFVDEIQDLVGVRAEMVLNMARLVLDQGGAVTVMGDPAQAIYDYQVRNHGGMDSRRFLNALRKCISKASNHREFRLEKYFRYSDPDLERFVDSASRALGADGTEPEGRKLQNLLQELDAHDIEDVPRLIGQEGSLAILTRRNADVYQLAHWFREQGFRPRVITGSRVPWPGWIGLLSLGFEQDHMSRDLARRRFDLFIGESAGIDFDVAWRFLVEQRLADENHFDLAAAASSILARDPITGMSSPESADIVISNIHKSKGREFDRVLVLSPDRNWSGNPEEIRTYYVAATRARNELALLRHDPRIVRRPAYGRGYTNDVILTPNQLPRVAVQGLEDLGLDTLIDRSRTPEEVRRMQKELWESHTSGRLSSRLAFRHFPDEARLWLVMEDADGLSHERLCRASESLCSDVGRIARDRFQRHSSDVRLSGFRHIELVTCAFQPEDRLARECLGAGCLAVAPALVGLGEVAPI